ncbi:DUF401 family protein [Thermogladius sp. KZ2Tp1]|uniref:DUF401 family protein n=1 Tax=Thermogladius sp. KZ2Tp1 TaxID=3136289 RepID=UPI003DA87411
MSVLTAGFIAALALMIATLAAGLKPYISVLASLTLFSVVAYGPAFPVVWWRSVNQSFLVTFASLVAAMYLAELYRGSAISKQVVESLESVSPRLAGVSIPAVIGLLPMPGGAYVSATLVNDVYERADLNPEEKTFLNFWFRHIWITVWPLYQGVIIASYITGMDVREISLSNIPITLASVASGLPFLFYFMRLKNSVKRRGLRGLVHLWPFVSIAVLNLVLNINVFFSVFITILAYTLVYRVKLEHHVRALKYSLNPHIIVLVAASLVYGYAISESGLAYELGGLLRPVEVSIFVVTALIVVATGFEFTFSSIAFPVFRPYLNPVNVFYGFLGGFTGSMLSPVHACLVLSAEFYKANLRRVYRYLLPATALSVVTGLILKMAL